MPSRRRRALAAGVVLLVGVAVGGVSVIADAAPAGATAATTSISGLITLPQGAPPGWMNGVSVTAEEVAGSDTDGTVDPQTGLYSITGLAPGSYRVEFHVGDYTDTVSQQLVSPGLAREYFGGTADFASATPVSTSVSAPATGVDVTLQLGGTISGTVTTAAGAAAVGVGVYSVSATDPEHLLSYEGMTDGSGAYSVTRLLAGSYKIFLSSSFQNAPGGPSIAQSYVGGLSYAAASSIAVTAGSTTSGQDAVVAPAAATASRPAAPTVTVTSSTATAVSMSWGVPAPTDPVLLYTVSLQQLNQAGVPDLIAAAASGGQYTIQAGGLSNLVFVSAMTASAVGAVGVVVHNAPSDAAAPAVSAVDSGQGALTLSGSGSAPSNAVWWFEYLPPGGGAADLRFGQPGQPGVSSYTFTGLDRSIGGTVYAGWTSGIGGSQSQIATLALAPAVNPWFQAKWQQLGGASGSLGQPTAAMQCQSTSCWQQFTGGVLTSDGSEIVELSTAYVTTWLANGGPDGELGLVAGPESCFGSYCVTPFAHGVVTWTPNVGVTATVVNAWFEAKWKQLGGVTGSLGSPTAAMVCQSSACWQQFTGGMLTSDGAQIVKLSTAYVSTWLAWGGPNGDLGLVSGAEACYGSYCQTPFSGGVLVWVPNSGVFPVVKSWFYPAWIVRGGAAGSLGLPTAAMQCQSAACYQLFQNGTLTSSTSAIVALSSAYVSTWLSNGGPGGTLGLITGPETCYYGIYCQVVFQHGSLVWQPGQGVHLVALGQPPIANPGNTKSCSNFATQAAAQAWFDAYYPYYGDVAHLDENHNGVACENLH